MLVRLAPRSFRPKVCPLTLTFLTRQASHAADVRARLLIRGFSIIQKIDCRKVKVAKEWLGKTV